MKNWTITPATRRPIRFICHMVIIGLSIFYFGWGVLIPFFLLSIDVELAKK